MTKVLVFESDQAFAGELRSELGRLGCSTTVVDDGNVGLQQAAADRPDLVLLSIELPRMNGFSVCNKLKKDAKLKDVPLIIMSSESSEETFEQHKKLRTRAEDYVHKPIAFGELLNHIQAFVRIEGAPASQGADIVIDDEIEIATLEEDEEDADQATRFVQRPPSAIVAALHAGAGAVAAPPKKSLDADVDAFADAAFGKLTGPAGEEAPSIAQARTVIPGVQSLAPQLEPPSQNGAADSVTSPASTRFEESPPSKRQTLAPRSASKPPAAVDLAEYERVRVEADKARAHVGEVERQLAEARDELEKLRIDAGETERLQREVEELKSKLAAGPRTGGISSKEFLDLREALNRKDKEILAFKEQGSKKDRELVESHDRALALERSKSELDDKLLRLERELAETRERAEALAADKDLAKKAGEDLKARLEKTRADAEAKERQIGELRAKQAEESVASEAKVAAMRAELDQTLADERAEHARALDEAETRRRSEVEQAERHEREALSSQDARLREEHDGKLAALRREHEEEVDRIRGGAERKREDALAALRAEHDEKVKGLENDRDACIAAVEARAAREGDEAKEKLAKLDMDLSAARGELAALREAKEKAEAESAAKAAELEKERDAARTRGADLERELGDVRGKLESETARAQKATAKWDADRQSLERAKDALAVALAQIEEAEARV